MTTAGEKIGEHSGAEFYTIGQRHIDADFAFPKTGGGALSAKPLYVASKDAATNTVMLAEGSDDPALYRTEVELAQMNFISGDALHDDGPLHVRARVRYRQPLSEARFQGLPRTGIIDWCLPRRKSSWQKASRRCSTPRMARCLAAVSLYKVRTLNFH